MANLKHAIKQGIVALKAKNIQPVMQTVGDECLLKGKTALVVGGSGGIGKAVAKAFRRTARMLSSPALGARRSTRWC